MCGIVGYLSPPGESATLEIIQAMARMLAHRGPDDEGTWIEDNIALGHRRLAIIDLSPAGHQPMISVEHRYVISYNGEVYNFRELRAELEKRGYWFRSDCDTEVVLNAFIEWGDACWSRFNGMFAAAVWDRKERVLTLARDRYGVKPIYYAEMGGVFLFASEVKAFRRHPDFSPALDYEALLEYFTFQNFFTMRTLHRGVSLVEPGTYLKVRRSGGGQVDIQSVNYWDFDFTEWDHPPDDQQLIEDLDQRLVASVHRQLVSDVDVQAYLSGGMDSGTITALAASRLPCMRSFTIGFDLSSASGLELAFDERATAERLSYLFQTEHYEMVLKSGDMERCMRDLVWHLEEPRVGQSYPNWYAAKLASRFGKVVLAGVGGDEIFGGYPWRYYRGFGDMDFEAYVDRYYDYWQRLAPNKTLHRLFAPIWDRVAGVWTRDIMRGIFKHPQAVFSGPADSVNHSLYLEAKTFLHGLLVVEDKLSMAHSLEVRVPFLDNDLVDFAQRLPVRCKLAQLDQTTRVNENEAGKRQQHFKRTRDGKLLLREAMRRHLPDDIVDGVKQGFSAPDASWFKGDSIDYVRDTLYPATARIYDYFDRETVRELLDLHLEGKENKRLFIWSLLNFEQWLELFLNSTNTSAHG